MPVFKYRWRNDKLLFNRAGWASALSLLFPDHPGPEDLWPTGPPFAAYASITAWTSSVSKKDIHIPDNNMVVELKQ
jgi:hypothetical protein